MKINITCSTDNNYMQHCMAMLCSLYETNKEHDITTHILTDNLSEKYKEMLVSLSERYNNKCKIHHVDPKPLEGVLFRKNRPLSMAAYFRIMLPTILPNIDRILYLDCDMIVLEDISDLFNLKLDGYALAACRDSFPYTDQHRMQLEMPVGTPTFCSGMMLINLGYWRENDSQSSLIEYSKRPKKEIWLHDQDSLNYVFKNKWYTIPPKWNRYADTIKVPVGTNKDLSYFDKVDYAFHPKILHYASNFAKPWYDAVSPEYKIYRNYVKLSGFPNPVFDRVKPTKKIKMFKRYCAYNLKIRIAYILEHRGFAKL